MWAVVAGWNRLWSVSRCGGVAALTALLACSGGEVDSAGLADTAFGGGTGGPNNTGPATTGVTGLTSGADGTGGESTDGESGSVGGCVDDDGDGYGVNCDAGPDCDDANAGAWTDAACETCVDADADGWFGECDAYPEGTEGPDCDDSNGCVWTEAGCANCVDQDEDGVWVGCDVYGDCAPGPDCHDGNASVGEGDAIELCNGVAENCAGEIDPFPADEMCPPAGVATPGVTGWTCEPPAPGEDGCVISECETDLVDLDSDALTGCECESLPPMDQGVDCAGAIDVGNIADVAESVTVEGNAVPPGRVVWYRFRGVDQADTSCDNYHVRVNFLSNPGNQYAFSVGRGSCGAVNTAVECNDYTWATDMRITDAGVLTGQCPCYAPGASPTTNVSTCESDTADYYVAVYRVADTGGMPTCAPYQLAFSNGVYDSM